MIGVLLGLLLATGGLLARRRYPGNRIVWVGELVAVLVAIAIFAALGACGDSSSPAPPDAGAFCASTFPHGPCVHRDAGPGDAP